MTSPRTPRVRTTALALAAGALALLPTFAGLTVPAQAASVGDCPVLDSGRVVVPGHQDQITVTAPAGRTIVGYCLKSAGLRGTTGAPYQVALDAPVTSVVLKHRDGGNLTHYSLVYGAVATQPTTQQPTSQPTQQPTTQPTTPTTQPTTPTTPTTTPTKTPTTQPETPDEPEIPSTPANPPVGGPRGFDWDWTYPDPSCSGLTVPYPGDIPADQANDVNVRIATDAGTRTLNFHRNDGTWTGTVGFVFAQHPQWPVDARTWTVEWVQVGGTNYHWRGDVDCVVGDVGAPVGVTSIDGWRTQTTVQVGRSAKADAVTVDQAGADPVVLQKRTAAGGWSTVSTVTPDADGDATVRFPREKKRGTSVYRLRATGSESATGASSDELRVRVTR
ncbi:hypothetical protein [Microlunatus flavus]|nr:hypothetical protein [Microlunatus flavus]